MDLNSFACETPRLVLRAVVESDRDAIYRAFTDAITRYMEPATPRDPRDTARFLAETCARMRRGEEVVCAVLDREDGRFLGCAGLHELRSPAPEVGIWIAAEAQGAGRGREAVSALLAWARETLPDLDFFRYPVDRDNAPSRRIAEAFRGTVHASYDRRTVDGRRLHLLEYHLPADA